MYGTKEKGVFIESVLDERIFFGETRRKVYAYPGNKIEYFSRKCTDIVIHVWSYLNEVGSENNQSELTRRIDVRWKKTCSLEKMKTFNLEQDTNIEVDTRTCTVLVKRNFANTVSDSDIEILRRFEEKILRTIVGATRFIPNGIIRHDLRGPLVKEYLFDVTTYVYRLGKF